MWIGAYEFQHCPDVPWRVVLNECIELAKEFGGTDGHKYVNGVLNGLAPQLRAAEVDADRQSAQSPSMKISGRAQRIEPFYVMEVAKAASALAREVAHSDAPDDFPEHRRARFHRPARWYRRPPSGPSTTAPPSTRRPPACRPCASASAAGTASVSVCDVPASRIVVTAGASAALQLACLALIEAGDEILMPDPSYPCNRHFVSAAEGTAVLIPTTAQERFQLSADKVAGGLGAEDARRAAGLARPTPPAPRSTRTSCAASTRWCSAVAASR